MCLSAVSVLKRMCRKDVVEHSFIVRRRALGMAKRLGKKGIFVDLGVVENGALLHDIGRCKSNGILHGALGAEIAGKAGFGKRVCKVVERHVLAGVGERVPEAIEEKIVCYADKLSDRGKFARLLSFCKGEAGRRLLALFDEMENVAGAELNVYFVVLRKGKFLLLKRRDSGVWEFPGGGVERNESLQDAAKREAEEESGLKVKVWGVLCTTSKVFFKNNKRKRAVYVVFSGSGRGKVVLSCEHCAFVWADVKKAKKMRLGYNARAALEYMENPLESGRGGAPRTTPGRHWNI